MAFGSEARELNRGHLGFGLLVPDRGGSGSLYSAADFFNHLVCELNKVSSNVLLLALLFLGLLGGRLWFVRLPLPSLWLLLLVVPSTKLRCADEALLERSTRE